MIKIYIANISYFRNIDLYSIENLDIITDSRKKRVQDFKRIDDKLRCFVAGLMLNYVCNVTNDNQIFYNKNNKPYLKNSNIYFNISHSGDYVVLAIADKEIGIDIEEIAPISDSVAKKVFTKEENLWLLKQNNLEAFYKLWTAKESIMKVTGEGFMLVPNTFSVLPIETGIHNILDNYYFLDWMVYGNYVICVSFPHS